jgi:hypothetical protein
VILAFIAMITAYFTCVAHLWWTECHQVLLFFQFFDFPLAVSFQQYCTILSIDSIINSLKNTFSLL